MGEVEDMWIQISTAPTILLLDSGSGKYIRPHDVSEIYSPPRVTEEARRRGLAGGWALDLTSADENGEPWDFDCEKKRSQARKLVKDTKPL